MCHERWAIHVVIKRKFFYIYINRYLTSGAECRRNISESVTITQRMTSSAKLHPSHRQWYFSEREREEQRQLIAEQKSLHANILSLSFAVARHDLTSSTYKFIRSISFKWWTTVKISFVTNRLSCGSFCASLMSPIGNGNKNKKNICRVTGG